MDFDQYNFQIVSLHYRENGFLGGGVEGVGVKFILIIKLHYQWRKTPFYEIYIYIYIKDSFL